MSFCPAFTWSPSFTRSLNPSPPISTVSTPTWIRSSTPLGSVRPHAWPVSAITTLTSQSAGAVTTVLDGSMATPSPMIFWENTSSGASSMGITLPSRIDFSSFTSAASVLETVIAEAVLPAACAVSPTSVSSAVSTAGAAFSLPNLSSFESLILPTINVSVNGITIATAIARRKIPQYSGLMERIPGSPPTPMLSASTPNPTEIIAAQQDPTIPHTSGNTYFRLTPKSAGSVTPK